jgi:DNA-binding NtrC family response regulator
LFEAEVDGGTLSDEYPISPEIQVKLLRVIQSGVPQTWSLENIQVDVRIVAATNTDLQAAVHQGTFRDDLFYRLNVIVIKIPPLRERAEDIPLLARHFIKKYGEENQREGLILEPSALKILMEYSWPGNVRELENVMERSVVLSQGNSITPDLFPMNLITPYPKTSNTLVDFGTSLRERVGNFEKAIILAALEKTGWNQKAAQILFGKRYDISEKSNASRSGTELRLEGLKGLKG